MITYTLEIWRKCKTDGDQLEDLLRQIGRKYPRIPITNCHIEDMIALLRRTDPNFARIYPYDDGITAYTLGWVIIDNTEVRFYLVFGSDIVTEYLPYAMMEALLQNVLNTGKLPPYFAPRPLSRYSPFFIFHGLRTTYSAPIVQSKESIEHL